MLVIDPSVEACQQLVAHINAGGVYALEATVAYSELLIDPLEEIDGLRVDLCTEKSRTLNETLDVEDRTSHHIRVWIRSKVTGYTNAIIDPLKLLVRQLFQRVNNFTSAGERVKVWECDIDDKASPEKTALRNAGLFASSILLRVEVEAAAE